MLHRRESMIRLGQLGLGAVTLPGLLRAEQARSAKIATGVSSPLRTGKAKSCILIYLWGGLRSRICGT